ncbi:MAG: TIGR01459 family HAD-type hydrolase [Hyphomicrobiales bacterium]
MTMPTVPLANGLSSLVEDYDLVLCDVWGVIHNGISVFNAAPDALAKFRQTEGKHVILLTNAPRPAWWIKRQLDGLGMRADAYDDIVTSGDVTRLDILNRKAQKVYPLGPEKDLNFYDDLPIDLVDAKDAELVSVTGLIDDSTETPDDYHEMLDDFLKRGLPMICANPDIVVELGDKLIYCGGALAQKYKQMGGEALYFGKPHAPIYQRALERGAELFDGDLDKKRVLAVGDGIATDVKGANDNGLDCLFVTAGIHSAENGPLANPTPENVAQFLVEHKQKAKAFLPRLFW